MYQYLYKNLSIKKQIIKVIEISSKISVKTILMTKPVILSPNSQKANRRQTIVSFGSKILKLCPRIKTYVEMSFLKNLGR